MQTKQELRQLHRKELLEELNKSTLDYIRAKMEIKNGFSKDSNKMVGLKKYVARIKTLLREEEMKGQGK